MEKREIIGYKAPTDLFDGLIKKGDIYINRPNNSSYPYKPSKTDDWSGSYVLPKEIVEAWEPVYKEEYKAGDWVIAKCVNLDTHYIGRYVDNNHISNWAPVGESSFLWLDIGLFSEGIIRKATNEEILNYLTLVAKKKYRTGNIIDQKTAYNGSGGKFPLMSISNFHYNSYSGNFTINRTGVYKDSYGIWASVVEEPVIKISGYEVIFSKDEIIINRENYHFDEIQALHALMQNHNSQIKSINVGCKGQEALTFDVIDKIYKRLKNK